MKNVAKQELILSCYFGLCTEMFYGTEILEYLNLLSPTIYEHTMPGSVDALTVKVVGVVGLVINFIQSIIKGFISFI